MVIFEGRELHQIEMLLVEDLVPVPDDAVPAVEQPPAATPRAPEEPPT